MTDLIKRLRDTASKGVSVWGDLQMEAAAEIERLRDLLDKLPAELRCIAMDYGMYGNIAGVDAANYCADHIDAARAALGEAK